MIYIYVYSFPSQRSRNGNRAGIKIPDLKITLSLNCRLAGENFIGLAGGAGEGCDATRGTPAVGVIFC